MNMSYCRFENTLADFRDCVRALGEEGSISSASEKAAAFTLIMTACSLIEELNLEDFESRAEREKAIRAMVQFASEKPEQEDDEPNLAKIDLESLEGKVGKNA